jgi:hypothetical protein
MLCIPVRSAPAGASTLRWAKSPMFFVAKRGLLFVGPAESVTSDKVAVVKVMVFVELLLHHGPPIPPWFSGSTLPA